MPRRTLNLGILAHVDAGKTTLTERVLYAAGVIDTIGSVDAGTTQTDSLALERQRGITIRSAVVSFAVGGVTVNLIDTPGHPDFIAEVERVLSVLDGAVLVISAVEGVQPQTRVLMRALRRLRIPALLFVNKINRAGAGEDRILRAISTRLSPAVVPMGSASGLGTRAAGFTPWREGDAGARARLAEILAERDEGILAAYVDNELGLPYARLRQELAAQARRALVYPVFFGSAVTGAGMPPLIASLTELLRPGRVMPPGRSPAASSRSSAGPAARSSPTSGCSPAPSAPATGCGSAAATRARSPRSARSSLARPGPARLSRPARSPSCAAWTRSRSATRSATVGRG